MGRKFAPFEVVVHFTGKKNNLEIQKRIDDFYIAAIESILSESALSDEQTREVLDRIADDHKNV